MTPLDILGLAVGLLIVGGVIALALWYSARSSAYMKSRVLAINQVMQAFAAPGTGFVYQVAPSYAHPVLGEVPSFGSLQGKRGDFEVRVDVDSYNVPSGARAHLRATMVPSEGHAFDVARRSGTAAWLGERGCKLEDLGEKVLVVRTSGPRTWGRYNQWYDVPTTPSALEAFLDTAVDAARQSIRAPVENLSGPY